MLLSYLLVTFVLNALVTTVSAKAAAPAHHLARGRSAVAQRDLASARIHALLSGNIHSFDLESRQTGSCGSGNKACGTGCIPTTYTCCSDGLGGCPTATANCVPGGCCPKGKTCNGVGGGCNDGETDCGNDCIPPGGTCCPDKSGCIGSTYCYQTSSGSYSCCLDGETCGGGGSGPPSTGTGTCSADQTECGDGCMPTSASCCADGRYCDAGDYCVLLTSGRNGCCPVGDTCSGVVGGGGASSISSSVTFRSPSVLSVPNTFTSPSLVNTFTEQSTTRRISTAAASSSAVVIVTEDDSSSVTSIPTRTTTSRTSTLTTPGSAITSNVQLAGSSRLLEAGIGALLFEGILTWCLSMFI